jgi:OOP family OmpA-OmpF porin
MKYILYILICLTSIKTYSQITIRGAKNTEIVETNQSKGEVKEIKDINFTKTNEEKINPKYVIVNNIENSTVKTDSNAIKVAINQSNTASDLKDGEKNQLVIDLTQAKNTLDSINTKKTSESLTVVSKPSSNSTVNTSSPVVSTTVISNSSQTPTLVQEVKSSTVQKTTSTISGTVISNPNTSSSKSIFLEPKTEKIKQEVSIQPEKAAEPEKTPSITVPSKVAATEQATTLKNETQTSNIVSNENNEKQNKDSGIFFESRKQAETATTNDNPVSAKTTINEISPATSASKPLETVQTTTKPVETIQKPIEETATKPNYNLNNLDNLATETDLTNKNDDEKLNPKKGNWSVGLKFGIPTIIGDVNTKAGYGMSLKVQKAFGHLFSLRFEALALETYGLNTDLTNGTYANYKTRFSDYTLQGVFSLNNLNFYKKEPKVLYNVIIGGGLATRYTWTDLRKEDGSLHQYDNLTSLERKEKLEAIRNEMDRNYETSITKDVEKMSIKNTNILPTLLVGMGLDIKLSKQFDLNIETRCSNHFDDYLDGLKNGTQNDWLFYTSIGLTYKFGSKNSSILWTNPIYSKTEEIDALKKKVDEGNLLKDEDKDGIADIFDQDLNTPEKVPVDSRGIPSDLDKDGVADYLDAQPFSPLGAKVNEKGIAIDTDNDGVADILDLDNNTLPGTSVDASGRAIPTQTTLSSLKDSYDFELVLFDENSATIKKEYYTEMYKIARYIQANPNAVIQITGHTDVLAEENYNLNLSEKRANEVYRMLIELFKVPAKNLITKFDGEKNPLIKDLPEKKDPKLAPAYYLNRRVAFKILK